MSFRDTPKAVNRFWWCFASSFRMVGTPPKPYKKGLQGCCSGYGSLTQKSRVALLRNQKTHAVRRARRRARPPRKTEKRHFRHGKMNVVFRVFLVGSWLFAFLLRFFCAVAEKRCAPFRGLPLSPTPLRVAGVPCGLGHRKIRCPLQGATALPDTP